MTHPAIAAYDEAWAEHLRDTEIAHAELAKRGIRAWLLAKDIPTYLALMQGETVPVERLRPEALRRYGMRR